MQAIWDSDYDSRTDSIYKRGRQRKASAKIAG